MSATISSRKVRGKNDPRFYAQKTSKKQPLQYKKTTFCEYISSILKRKFYTKVSVKGRELVFYRASRVRLSSVSVSENDKGRNSYLSSSAGGQKLNRQTGYYNGKQNYNSLPSASQIVLDHHEPKIKEKEIKEKLKYAKKALSKFGSQVIRYKLYYDKDCNSFKDTKKKIGIARGSRQRCSSLEIEMKKIKLTIDWYNQNLKEIERYQESYDKECLLNIGKIKNIYNKSIELSLLDQKCESLFKDFLSSQEEGDRKTLLEKMEKIYNKTESISEDIDKLIHEIGVNPNYSIPNTKTKLFLHEQMKHAECFQNYLEYLSKQEEYCSEEYSETLQEKFDQSESVLEANLSWVNLDSSGLARHFSYDGVDSLQDYPYLVLLRLKNCYFFHLFNLKRICFNKIKENEENNKIFLEEKIQIIKKNIERLEDQINFDYEEINGTRFESKLKEQFENLIVNYKSLLNKYQEKYNELCG